MFKCKTMIICSLLHKRLFWTHTVHIILAYQIGLSGIYLSPLNQNSCFKDFSNVFFFITFLVAAFCEYACISSSKTSSIPCNSCFWFVFETFGFLLHYISVVCTRNVLICILLFCFISIDSWV